MAEGSAKKKKKKKKEKGFSRKTLTKSQSSEITQ